MWKKLRPMNVCIVYVVFLDIPACHVACLTQSDMQGFGSVLLVTACRYVWLISGQFMAF